MSNPAATILIVDDEIQNRRLLEALLGPEGYLTISVASGEEALASVAEHPPDLILLDIMMPGMDGYEVATTLKSDQATANIPIIMVTALMDRNARLAGLHAGVEDFLTKPVDRAELWLRVRNLLRLKSFGDLQSHSWVLEETVQRRTAELLRFRRAIDATSDAIYLVDRASMSFIHVNDAACRMQNKTREEVIASGPEGVLAVSRIELECRYDSIISSGRDAVPLEMQQRRADGSQMWVELRRHAQRSGGSWTIVTLVRDITDRKEAEKSLHDLAQLRLSEAARQAVILNALPAHIALLDPQGVIISVNESWRRFGKPNAVQGPGYEIGMNYPEICYGAAEDAPSDARKAAIGLRSVLTGGAKSFSTEYSCPSPTKLHWFMMTVTQLADGSSNGAVVMHVDVTAERQTEASLHASELLFLQMAENINDVFFLQAFDSSQIFYVSPAYEKIWGRSCESLYENPTSWSDAIHPDDLHYAFAQLNEGRDSGFDYEFRIVRPDGELRWIHVRGYPIPDEAGNPYRTAGVCSDITERKQAGLELRESERRFSDLLENVELLSLMLDRDARITYCNEYLLIMTGWTREEVIGRDWFELFLPEKADLKADFMALLANQPEAWHHEDEILTRSGERRLIRWNNSVLRSATGEVVGTASIGEDITEQKIYHESLKQNEERTRLIVESALDAVVVMDAAGRVIDWNSQAEATFGWTREEVIGTLLTETIIPARYAEGHNIGLSKFLQTGEGSIINRRREVFAMHRDGHEIPVELSVTPVTTGGVLIFSSFIRDLSERNRADEIVQKRAAELERFHRLSVGRELQMIELKEQINALATQAGQQPPYDMAFLASAGVKPNPGHG